MRKTTDDKRTVFNSGIFKEKESQYIPFNQFKEEFYGLQGRTALFDQDNEDENVVTSAKKAGNSKMNLKGPALQPRKKKVNLLNCQIFICVCWLIGIVAIGNFFGQENLKEVYTQYAEIGFNLSASEQIARFANAGIKAVQNEVESFFSRLTFFGFGTGAGNSANSETGSNANSNLATAGQGSLPTGEIMESSPLVAEGPVVNANVAEDENNGTPAPNNALLNGQGGSETILKVTESGEIVIPEDATLNSYVLSSLPLLPTNGAVTSLYGFRSHPITGEQDFHTGLDIAAPKGTAIIAAYGGTVLEAGYSYTGGNYVKIQHGSTVETGYFHMQDIYVKPGQNVFAGQTIGTVGSTGLSTGYHLHFELKINGVRVNPFIALEHVL